MRTLVLILLLAGVTTVQAQLNQSFNIEKAGEIVRSFENNAYFRNQVIPFRNIIVIDKRFDSSKAGYISNGMAYDYVRIKLRDSWSATLTNYFIKQLDSASHQSLVIILKSYWLQKGVLDEFSDKKIRNTPATGDFDIGGKCIADMDIYVQSDSTLQALFRINYDFLNLLKNYRKGNIDEFCFLPFDSVAMRLASLPVQEILAKKRKISWKEVIDNYDHRFDMPVLKDTAIKKGIFMTFEEFKQNRPSVINFKFVNGKVTDEVYSIDNGNENLIIHYWGFCDGKDLYIQAGLSAFKAVRQQNTFEIFGSRYISNPGNSVPQGSVVFRRFDIDKRVLQLNMETGELY